MLRGSFTRLSRSLSPPRRPRVRSPGNTPWRGLRGRDDSPSPPRHRRRTPSSSPPTWEHRPKSKRGGRRSPASSSEGSATSSDEDREPSPRHTRPYVISPFTKRIVNLTLTLDQFSMPTVRFDGSSDPNEHLTSYASYMGV